jgi:hypothetical protein
MARKLDHYDWSQEGKKKYPWDQWCDGDTWEVVQGVDFHTEAGQFVSANLHGRARSLGKNVRTRIVRDGDQTLVRFQFYGKED